MKVIIDTNVFVAGIFFPKGIPRKILHAWKKRKFNIAVSSEILEEYKETVEYLKKKYPPTDASEFLELAALNSEYYQPKKLLEPICEDPDDDMFVACALAGSVKIIVSGDKHLLDISGFHNIEVLKPRVFLERYIR